MDCCTTHSYCLLSREALSLLKSETELCAAVFFVQYTELKNMKIEIFCKLLKTFGRELVGIL